MRTLTQREVEILQLHAKWLEGKEDGVLADLRVAKLQGANLRYADLRGAHINGAYLNGASLHDSDLRGAFLQDSNLQDANLQNASLRYANLKDANLQNADLQHANLQDTNLQDADLSGANLDFSSGIPMSCRGLGFKADGGIVGQMLYHAMSVEVLGDHVDAYAAEVLREHWAMKHLLRRFTDRRTDVPKNPRGSHERITEAGEDQA